MGSSGKGQNFPLCQIVNAACIMFVDLVTFSFVKCFFGQFHQRLDPYTASYWQVLIFSCGSQWVVKGALDVDIGANPSAEGGGEDEGVDDQAVKVVDIVDTFRLQVCSAQSQMCYLC